MDYRLIITERAEELLDQLVQYIVVQLQNEQAASHLLREIDNIYDRLEENPYQFPVCREPYLKVRQYRIAVTDEMNYVLIFRIAQDASVYILGIFHESENHRRKLQ